MKNITKKMTLKLKRLFNFGRRKVVDIDNVIEDNMRLIKEIRMNRIKFYKYYKKSMH